MVIGKWGPRTRYQGIGSGMWKIWSGVWEMGNGKQRMKITAWKMRYEYSEMEQKFEKGNMMRIEK